MHSTTLTLRHTRSPKSIQSFKDRETSIEELAAEKFNGEMIKFARPMGEDYYISLFDGEKTYFISIMGGHFMSLFAAASEVDGPQKVLYEAYSATRGKEIREKTGENGIMDSARAAYKEMVVEFKALLKDELPKEAFEVLEKDKIFEA